MPSPSPTLKQKLRRNWLRILTAPMVHTPGLMALFVVMQCAIPYHYYFHVKPQLTDSDIFGNMCIMLSEATVMAWCMLLMYHLLGLWRKWVAMAWGGICMAALSANAMIDFALLNIYRCSFTSDIAGIIAATNPGEGADFVRTYIDADFVAQLALFISIYGAAYLTGSLLVGKLLKGYILSHHPQWCSPIRYTALALTAAAWSVTIASAPTLVSNTNLRSKGATFATLNLGHEIVPQHPTLAVDTSNAPTDIVIIIGESHCRTHSSLYGYPLNTQPLLQQLADDSLLHVFIHPTSPAQQTMRAITQIIGTYEGQPDRNWYECLTLLEAANLSGYRTYWLSNQAAKGVYDNPVVKIAEFCDIHEFTNDGMTGVTSAGYDEEILPLIDKHITDRGRKLTIIHLMGSHVSYASRYPASYEKFTADDYIDCSENQRQTLAEYDNSLLYNDFITSSIMRRYATRDAVVIYLSDHAQDLFDSSDDYFGHSTTTPESMAAGSAIPFYVYLSPAFIHLHPSKAHRIAAAVDRPINTTDLIFTVMDLMGTTLPDDPSIVTVRSFFHD